MIYLDIRTHDTDIGISTIQLSSIDSTCRRCGGRGHPLNFSVGDAPEVEEKQERKNND